MIERQSIQVSYRLNGMRLDAAISDSIAGLSRRRAKAIVDMGGVYINTKRVRIASRTVGKGDRIDIEYNKELFEPGKKADLELHPQDILYFDNDLVVINKPAGLPAQATRDQAVLHVIPALAKCLASMGHTNLDLQLVHRLDKDTTGVLIIATTKAMMTYMTDQFRLHRVQKTYHALCWGIVDRAFEVNCALSSIGANSGKVKVVKSGGKPSQTFFKGLKSFPEFKVSLVECRPITGRSHQIRVHLDESAHPIVGDKVYGEGKRHTLSDELTAVATHQFLHAAKISFCPKPNSEAIEIAAPYPSTLVRFLELLEAVQS